MRTSTSSIPYWGMTFRASARMVRVISSRPRTTCFFNSSRTSAGTSSRISPFGTTHEAPRTLDHGELHVQPCLGHRIPHGPSELHNHCLLALLQRVEGPGNDDDDRQHEDSESDIERVLHGYFPPLTLGAWTLSVPAAAGIGPDSRRSQGSRAFWSLSTIYRAFASGRMLPMASR